MNIHESFYNIFEGVNKEMVDNTFNTMSTSIKNQILFIWNPRKLQKTTTEAAINCIHLMKKSMYKQDIREKVNTGDLILIGEIINNLKPKSRERLLKQFSINGEYILKEEVTLSIYNANIYTIKKINYCIDNNILFEEKKNIHRNHGSIFEKLKDYDKDEIIRVVKSLDEDKKLLIYSKYGEDLNNALNNNTTEKNNTINEYLTRLLKKQLKGLKEGTLHYYSYYDIFDADSKTRLYKLNEKELNRLHYVFGENLDKEYIYFDENFLGLHIKKKLSKKDNSIPYISLIDLLIDCKQDSESMDEFKIRIKACINSLGTKSKKLIYEKYGEDLLNTQNRGLSRKDNIFVNSGIIKRLRVLLNNENLCYKPLYEILGKDNIVYLPLVIENLNKEELMLLKKKYNEDLLGSVNRNTLSRIENEECNNVIKKVKRIIYKHKADEVNMLMKDYLSLLKLTKTEEYLSLCEMYDKNVSLAIMLKIYKKELSNEQIYKITDVKPLTFLYLTTCYLQSKKLILK